MTLRIVLLESSPRFARALKAALEHDGETMVVGEAVDARQALAMVDQAKPDAMVASAEAGVDVVGICRSIMSVMPLPVILLAPEGEEGAPQVNAAIAQGAVGVLTRPRSPAEVATSREWRRLVRDIRGLAEVKLVRVRQSAGQVAARPEEAPAEAAPEQSFQLLTIGCSTGGPQALQTVLSALPADFPVPVLVVQHMAAGFVDNLVHWLDGTVPMAVRLAANGEVLQPGTVLIAPDGVHLVVMTAGSRLMAGLVSAPPVGGFRPAATTLFTSAANVVGARAIGVLLTGMGSDGADGLLAMRRRGAFTIAQDEGSSVVYGMNAVAVELGAAQAVVPLDRIPAMLRRIVGNGERREAGAMTARNRVLIVDDTKTFRTLAAGILRRRGWEVVGEAEDGVRAVEMCRQLAPDLVLLDIAMPRMDGVAALKAIKDLGGTTTVIMCTTHDNIHLVDDCLMAGAADYIHKDKLDDLGDRLRPYLG